MHLYINTNDHKIKNHHQSFSFNSRASTQLCVCAQHCFLSSKIPCTFYHLYDSFLSDRGILHLLPNEFLQILLNFFYTLHKWIEHFVTCHNNHKPSFLQFHPHNRKHFHDKHHKEKFIRMQNGRICMTLDNAYKFHLQKALSYFA